MTNLKSMTEGSTAVYNLLLEQFETCCVLESNTETELNSSEATVEHSFQPVGLEIWKTRNKLKHDQSKIISIHTNYFHFRCTLALLTCRSTMQSSTQGLKTL